MKYRLVIFDLDGTLADTSRGILNSHRYAHKMMGRPEPGDSELAGVIGGPLLQTYRTRFGFSDADAGKAVEHYRRYYAEHGIWEAELYPGMAETLRTLNTMGLKLGVATLKTERFAKEMLRHMQVFDYFSAIYGMDENDSRTKEQLMRLCMDAVGAAADETVMVGDSIHDLDGAEKCGVDFLAVTYGFGFEEKDAPGGTEVCRLPREIISRILPSAE